MTVAPDAVEPVVGWRCWRVRDTADGFVLTSAHSAARWAPRLALEASCERADGHRTPAAACTCGIYAARYPDLVLPLLPPTIRAATIITPAVLGYDTVMVAGRVSLWGDVIEGDRGWRGRYAYPRELIVPAAVRHYRRLPGRGFEVFDSSDLAAALAELYGLPTHVTRSMRPDVLALRRL